MPGNWRCVNEGGKFRVVCTKELPGTRWLDALVDAGCEVHISDSTYIMPNEEIIEKMGTKCDGVVGQLTELWGEELFEALKKAGGKVYSNYAVGFNNVTVPEATKRGIAVGNTPGVLTETTAEMAITLTFGAARRLSESEVFTKAGKYEGWLPDLFLGKRLWGGTVGIIGAGRIGATYAKMLAPGHQVCRRHNPYLPL
jgi:hydroxypyruvate reductase 1